MLVKGAEDYWLHVFDDYCQPDPYIAQGETEHKEKMHVTHKATALTTTVVRKPFFLSYQEMFNEGKRRIEKMLQDRATQAAKGERDAA